MKSGKWFKAGIAAALVLALVFIGAGLAGVANRSYTTQIALEQTVLKTADVEMYIVRDESYLMGESGYTVVPLAENAERIAKDSTVAAYFASEQSAKNYVSVSLLKDKLASYKIIDKQLSLANVDMDKLTASVDSSFESIVNSVYTDDYSNLAHDKLEFLEKLSLKQISLGESIDCSAKIAALEGTIASLEAAAVPVSIVQADRSGYFVSELDGYEGAVTVDSIDGVTVDFVNSALKTNKKGTPKGCLGKVIAGYDWYMMGVMDTVDATRFKPGSGVRVIIGSSAADMIRVEVKSVSDSKDGKSAVVFESNLMNGQLATMRKVPVKVVLDEMTGLKVSKDAVRVSPEGENGVYIIRGNIVNYRSLNVIYSEDEFVIAKAPDNDSNIELSASHLKLYDEMIISGKDLTDGMVIG